jgi:hypothetical protein
MKWLRALKRTMIILVLYGIGVLEAYFIPRHGYGLEWVLAAIGLTAFLAGYWVRTRWND